MKCHLPPLLLVASLAGCQPVPMVTPNPVPPPDKLRPEDCRQAATLYQRRLQTEPPSAASPEAPPTLAAFTATCEQRLAGHARRVILRCWHDATSVQTFLNCNGRF